MIIVLLFLTSDHAIWDDFDQCCLVLVGKLKETLIDRASQKTHNAQIVQVLIFGVSDIGPILLDDPADKTIA